MTIYQMQFQRYARSFKQPLVTSHGVWAVREGMIIHLNGSPGEIAPLEWFGTESLAEAEAFCAGLNGKIERSQVFTIPDRLPCSQFAFEMALHNLESGQVISEAQNLPELAGGTARTAALLPTGKAAIDRWPSLYQLGHRTFKWKIGVAAIATELQQFQQLHQQLPQDCQLRLDANAGLSLAEANQWLERLVEYPIEYLEQPLKPGQFAQMQALAMQYPTKLALDESIANLSSLRHCHHQGWTGIYVIKPAIVGSPSQLLAFLQNHEVDAVFSSAFETEIGYAAGLELAKIADVQRHLGYGTSDWSDDSWK
jgi:O-succinylbenzoate synthase